MKPRYILAPEAARDLVKIWRYLKQESGENTADQVEAVIRSKIVVLAEMPLIGHWRRDLTTAPVRFFLVYSYFIVYLPETSPLRVVSILHSGRNVSALLKKRL